MPYRSPWDVLTSAARILGLLLFAVLALGLGPGGYVASAGAVLAAAVLIALEHGTHADRPWAERLGVVVGWGFFVAFVAWAFVNPIAGGLSAVVMLGVLLESRRRRRPRRRVRTPDGVPVE